MYKPGLTRSSHRVAVMVLIQSLRIVIDRLVWQFNFNVMYKIIFDYKIHSY